MSAVSNSVTPASSAACTTLCAAAGSSLTPKLLQPRPTAETFRVVVPKGRSRIGLPGGAEHALRIPAEDKIAVGGRDRKRLDTRHAVEVAHVERIVAAEQHVVGAGRRD